MKGRFKGNGTKAGRAKHSSLTKAQWADASQRARLLQGQAQPEVRAIMSAKARLIWSSPEMQALRSENTTKLWKSKKYAANVSAGLKRKWKEREHAQLPIRRPKVLEVK